MFNVYMYNYIGVSNYHHRIYCIRNWFVLLVYMNSSNRFRAYTYFIGLLPYVVFYIDLSVSYHRI